MKRLSGSVLAIFVSWSIIDYVIHGIILMEAYQQTEHLWRPMEEMKMGLMYIVVLLTAIVFALIYKRLITNKSITNAIQYGILFGIAVGLGMGYGSYSVMPITYSIAITWFLGTLIEYVVAGVLVGIIIKE